MNGCVYSCQHPAWGGAGECIANTGTGEELYCLCDDGFTSRDFFGAASCVPQGVQLVTYIAGTVVHLGSSLFMAWHASLHTKLPTRLRSSRRAKIRLRLSIWTSCASASMALVCFFGVVRAWTGYLMDTEILPLLMIIAGIVGAPVGMLALDLWVDSLPSQALPADSPEARFKQMVEKQDIFVLAAAGSTATIATVSGATLVFFDAQTLWSVTDVIGGITAGSAGLTFVMIGVRISRVIGHAEAQAKLNSKAFYRKARRKLWTQVAILTGVCVMYTTVAVVKLLLPGAMRTPMIPAMLYMLISSVAYVMIVYLSRPRLAAVSPLSPSAAAYQEVRSTQATQAKTHRTPQREKAETGGRGGTSVT